MPVVAYHCCSTRNPIIDNRKALQFGVQLFSWHEPRCGSQNHCFCVAARPSARLRGPWCGPTLRLARAKLKLPMRCGWKSSPHIFLLLVVFTFRFIAFERNEERSLSSASAHAYTHMSTPGRIRRFYGNRVRHFRFPKNVIGRSHTQQPTR